MTHNLNFLAQMGAYTCAFRLGESPERRRYWIGLGFFCALSLLARYQSGVLLIFPLLQALRVSWSRGTVHGLVLAGGMFLLAITPQILAWKVIYGQYFLYSYEKEAFGWRHAHWMEVLFSPWHGLFYWHPLLLVAGIGFVLWAAKDRSWMAGSWTLSMLLTFVVNATWVCWWFGASFGQRAFDGGIFFAMLGMSQLFHSLRTSPRLRAWLLMGSLVLIVWNIQLAWLARKGALSMENPVSYREMLQATRAYWMGS